MHIASSPPVSKNSLFQPGLAHALEEFGHWPDGIGNVLLNPCDRNVRLQFLKPSQSLTRLIGLTGLGKARDVNAVSAAQSRTLLDGLATEGNRFAKMSCEIVSSSYCHIEYRVLRIVRAHADGLLGMCDRLFGSPGVGGREIRIEVERASELIDRFIGGPHCVSNEAERKVCPRIAVVERYRSRGQSFRLPDVLFQLIQGIGEAARHQ